MIFNLPQHLARIAGRDDIRGDPAQLRFLPRMENRETRITPTPIVLQNLLIFFIAGFFSEKALTFTPPPVI
jgi:hypothetical protein